MKVHIMLISLLVMAPGLAFAFGESHKGNQLLDYCNEAMKVVENSSSKVSYLEAGFCMGFVTALLDAASLDSDPQKKMCISPDVETGQGVRILVRYLKDNPEKLHLSATGLALNAFRQAFRCK